MSNSDSTSATLDVEQVRALFPALSSPGGGAIPAYLDGPAGSQTPRSVVDAVARYMTTTNANHGGEFAASRASDALLDQGHRALADLLGSNDARLVAFGANMTSLTFALSRALARTWRPGDEVVVTDLDHDANVTPWTLAARDAGAVVRTVAIHRDDCTLDMDDLRGKLTERTRLVAVGCASNAVGTVNPVAEIARLAHDAGALAFFDAVHYAPHRLMDVTAWGCDFVACSAYKFFGPHVGVLWGRRELLEALPAYKLRPAPDELPGRWMTGTQNHEGIAGALAAVEYVADLGRPVASAGSNRRAALAAAFDVIRGHEESLCRALLAGLAQLSQVRVWGISDPARMVQRVPTVAITHARRTPREIAKFLDDRGVYVWHGNFYALPLTTALGLEPEGLVRIGLLHYNTLGEVERLLAALGELE